MNKNETRIKSKTGGEKCAKLAQMHLAPHDALMELWQHYGLGEKKYPSDPTGLPNYAKGFAWSLSYSAMMRHAQQFWAGEDLDEETGSKHLISVAWHALALVHFMNTKTGADDRWEHPHKKKILKEAAKVRAYLAREEEHTN